MSGSDALVHRAGESTVRVIEDLSGLGVVRSDDGHGIVIRGVVDGDELDVPMRLLPDSSETAPEKRRAVPGYEDDRDDSSHRLNAFPSTAP